MRQRCTGMSPQAIILYTVKNYQKTAKQAERNIVATWVEMSVDNRKAAQNLLDAECYRSSISRAYYTAYCAVTSQLAGKYTFPFGGNNPSHPDLLNMILNNLPALPNYKRREIKQAFERLWHARVEADYGPSAYIDRAKALNALRDASRVSALLEME